MIKSPAELTEKFDFIVCAHKAINPEAAPSALAPVVGENTTIVIIQNGVGNEEPFRRAFPTNSILTCVVCPPRPPTLSTVNTMPTAAKPTGLGRSQPTHPRHSLPHRSGKYPDRALH